MIVGPYSSSNQHKPNRRQDETSWYFNGILKQNINYPSATVVAERLCSQAPGRQPHGRHHPHPAPQTVTAADGAYPTGMHSSLINVNSLTYLFSVHHVIIFIQITKRPKEIQSNCRRLLVSTCIKLVSTCRLMHLWCMSLLEWLKFQSKFSGIPPPLLKLVQNTPSQNEKCQGLWISCYWNTSPTMKNVRDFEFHVTGIPPPPNEKCQGLCISCYRNTPPKKKTNSDLGKSWHFKTFQFLTLEYPPPPNSNLGKSWHFKTFQFWLRNNPPPPIQI